MPDREKVIVELTAGIEDAYHRCHCGLAVTMEKALSLLKAQEPVKPFFSSDRRWLCGNCMREVEKYGGDYYCPGCGRKLLWE